MKLISARASRAPGADQHREPRARHPRRALEIEDAERRPEVPVRLRLEVERARLAVAADFRVVLGASCRPARSRAAGSAASSAARSRCCSTSSSSASSCLICCAARLVRGEDRRRIQPLLLRARDLFARPRSARASGPRPPGSAARRARLERRRAARDRPSGSSPRFRRPRVGRRRGDRARMPGSSMR